MEGFRSDTYGNAFADIYDEWYGDLDDINTLIALLLDLAGSGPVLELGVGTGRIAIPLAQANLEVIGLDSSKPMLDRLAASDPNGLVTPVLGDMVDDLPAGPFSLIVIAFNTLFNLTEHDRQAACIAAAASRLAPGGRLLIDGIIPDRSAAGFDVTVDDVSIRDLTVDRVVLAVSRHRPDDQVAEGQFVEITESGGVRLRPWSVRYSTVEQIDAMATAAGLEIEHRWAGPDRCPFNSSSGRHLTVYRR